MSEKNLTAKELRELVHYDRATGIFTWLPRPDTCAPNRIFNSRFANKTAGTFHEKDGYINIQIGHKGTYRAHRLAWLYETGEWPRRHLDHKNLVGRDNWFDNLREASRSQNGANRRAYSNSKTGIKGVSPRKGGYVAQISVNKRVICLGDFPTKEQAAAAYAKAASGYFGEFARTN